MPNGLRSTLAPDTRLTLVTLGSAALRAPAPSNTAAADDAAGSTTLFDLGKPLALITYLACAPERSAAREHLIDLLWGDVEPEAAKHALRQTLWYMKKRLSDRQLVSGGDVLTLDGGLDCDRDALLGAAERGDADAVVRLYTGDFFPGFAAPGGVEFERWADAERQRLRSIFWRSAELIARQWMSTARMKEAQSLARRVRDLDLLREAGWRLVFETIIAGRDSVAASLEVEAFERVFDAEGIEPEPATRSLLRVLRQGSAPTDVEADASSRSLVAELVGREREFAQVIGAWDAARAGRPSHVHALATAGLGKSRLLTDVHARLRATRARTVLIRATLGIRDIPYGLVGELAHALAALPGASGISTGSARTLVALNPAVSSSFPSTAVDVRDDPGDALRRRTAALRELIIVLAEEQPLAVFIDDLQWSDAASRQVLSGIIGTLGGARALIVTAGRPTADITFASVSTEVIHLGPLPSGAVASMVASIATLPSEPWAEQLASELWHATGGSPLLILETLQLVLERGLLERNDGEWNAPRPHDLLSALQAGGALRHRVERLDRPERWLLTILAVAGSPLSADVLAAAIERPADETSMALVALEHRGFVVRQGAAWSPSHDEIAAMAIEMTTDGAVRSAAKAAGRAIIGQHSADLRWLRQAGVLLDRAQDQEGLAHAFNLFARVARRMGDRRDNAALARDFIGERMQALTRWLVRSLPVAHRLGLYSTPRLTAAAIGIVMFPILALGVRAAVRGDPDPPPDAVLLVGSLGSDSTARMYEVPIHGAGLTVGQLIQPQPERRPDWTFQGDGNYPTIIAHPDRESVLVDRVTSDTGGIDVFQVGRRGTRRLTSAFGDDQGSTPSPDGRYVAINTARWDPRSRYDIAVIDLTTGVTRQLTSTPDSDMLPAWSPDGTRIAFARIYWDGRRSVTCVIDVDGHNELCHGVADADVSPARAWYDVDHVLIQVQRDSIFTLGRMKVTTGVIDTIAVVAQGALPSPDGRWVVTKAVRAIGAAESWDLFPVEAPKRSVEIDLSKMPAGKRFLGWGAMPGSARFVSRVAIDGAGGPVGVGIAHRLTAVGLSPTSDTVPVRAVRWKSANPEVATIDSLGTLMPLRAGTVEIHVDVGGWRNVRRQIVIAARQDSVLLHETWRDGIKAPWRAFGNPAPRIDSAADGTVGMMNNGEGSHSSGVYSEEYPSADGLALDVRLSVPITDVQWQIIGAQLSGALDKSQLGKWDHGTGSVPLRAGIPDGCVVGYPGNAREGVSWGDSLLVGGGTHLRLRAPRTFRTGQWFDVRLQLFPDGRCGFAINGVPVAVSEPRDIWQPKVRVVFAGNSSFGTTILVGETTLRSGVPTDIDWTRASPKNVIPERPQRR